MKMQSDKASPDAPLIVPIKFQDDPNVQQLIDLMRATEIRINVLCGIGPHLRLVHSARLAQRKPSGK